jgi:hypothetical protein
MACGMPRFRQGSIPGIDQLLGRCRRLAGRRNACRSGSVPSSTRACRARQRSVHPSRMRARTIASVFTGHSRQAVYVFTKQRPRWGARLGPQSALEGTVFRVPCIPLKSSMVFGGPLLGDPDRHLGTATGSLTRVADGAAIRSPTARPRRRFGHTSTRSRCASRA